MCAYGLGDHETFFTRIPPLLRTAADAPKDPMSDCLAQIPKLVYTYYVSDNHGESMLHEDLLKLFRSIAVWFSKNDNEEDAYWNKYPLQTKGWIRSMVYELNLVVSRGSGPSREINLIALNLEGLENVWKSPTITFWLDRFKQTAFEERSKGMGYQKDSRRLKMISSTGHTNPRERTVVTVDPWNLQRQPAINSNPRVFSMGQTGGNQQLGPGKESRRERREQRDRNYAQQPSPNQGTLMIPNQPNRNAQQVPSPNKGMLVNQNRGTTVQPPNPGPYGPRLTATPVTPGRGDQSGRRNRY